MRFFIWFFYAKTIFWHCDVLFRKHKFNVFLPTILIKYFLPILVEKHSTTSFVYKLRQWGLNVIHRPFLILLVSIFYFFSVEFFSYRSFAQGPLCTPVLCVTQPSVYTRPSVYTGQCVYTRPFCVNTAVCVHTALYVHIVLCNLFRRSSTSRY